MKAASFLTAGAVLAVGTALALGGGPRTRPPYLVGIPPADYQYRERSASVILASDLLAASSGSLDTGALLAFAKSGNVPATAQPVAPPLIVSQPMPLAMPMPAPAPSTLVRPRLWRPAAAVAVPVVPLPSPPPSVVFVPAPIAPSPALTGPPVAKQKRFQFSQPLVVDHCAVSALWVTIAPDGAWSVTLRADQNPSPDDKFAPTIPPSNVQTIQLLRNQFHVEFRCYNTNGVPVGPVASTGVGAPVVASLPTQDFWVQRTEPLVVHKNGVVPALAVHYGEIDRIETEFYYYK